MNRQQYLEALRFCFQMECVGAIMGEVAMLLRDKPEEKRQLDLVRRIEAGNRVLCQQALEREGEPRPEVSRGFYRGGYKLGLQLGEGDWKEFLDRFEATVHPEAFTRYLLDSDGRQIDHEYAAVDVELLRHLVRHEQAFVELLALERTGRGEAAREQLEQVLASDIYSMPFGPLDPVGW